MDKFSVKKKLMSEVSVDISRKGNVDESIKDMIDFINSFDEYITTSSCSGRIIVVSKSDGDSCKKGCKWIFSSHTTVEPDHVLEKLKCSENNMTLKFEPFILHVNCRDIIAAKKMQDCALAAGFRNSGTVFGKKGNIMFAVRGTHGLEVPLSEEHGLMVTDDYIRCIIEKANQKMCENEKKIEHFSRAIHELKTEHFSRAIHELKTEDR